MPSPETKTNLWRRLPAAPRAIVSGLAIGLIAANVWPLLRMAAGPVWSPVGEVVFLIAFVWWASGHGAPSRTQLARGLAFRWPPPSSAAGWLYGGVAAIALAVTVHAAMVVLFRLVPFPRDAFRQGYDLSSIPTIALRWVAVVVSALSAGICEETGFRGYMQRPLERAHGPAWAIGVSALFFTLLHLTKGWATIGMVPVVLGAGLLLGALAWASRSLVPSMISHFVMDVGLFAYWWTGIAGTFTARPIGQTGIDTPFVAALLIFALSLVACLTCIWRLRKAVT
jgi:membrane protease YdiL (CAAX protease family)